MNVEVGDLVFAYAYRGEVKDAVIGVVCRVYPGKSELGWEMVSVWTPAGFELLPSISCAVICKKNKPTCI